MDQRTTQILFALIRSAICGIKLNQKERENFKSVSLPKLLAITSKHDIEHLLVWALKKNELVSVNEYSNLEHWIFKAVYRYEQIIYEYESLCTVLEKAKIPFLPLKGSIIRKYYPEEWMRTSCDIDILVHKEDLDKAVAYLSENKQYVEIERATHDVYLKNPNGVPVELHFDLVEEGRAKNAIQVLDSVWENVHLHENYQYWYEMEDAYFYFYHIAHMAKHFETGGCGIRPFVDLWILDHMENVNATSRQELLKVGGLERFAEASRRLNRIWFDGEIADEVSLQMQEFLLTGGLYGSVDNRVAFQQKKHGGKWKYLVSRIWAPYTKLKRYYPVLEKHRWMMPLMQVRRWFMLLRPDVADMAKKEWKANQSLDTEKADRMYHLLQKIGL